MLIRVIFVIAKTSGGGGRVDLQLFCGVLTRHGQRRAERAADRRGPADYRRRRTVYEPGPGPRSAPLHRAAAAGPAFRERNRRASRRRADGYFYSFDWPYRGMSELRLQGGYYYLPGGGDRHSAIAGKSPSESGRAMSVHPSRLTG